MAVALFKPYNNPVPRRALRLGRLLVTTCMQPAGAPLIDEAYTSSNGCGYDSFAVLLTPWRRSLFGGPAAQRALVIGWRG